MQANHVSFLTIASCQFSITTELVCSFVNFSISQMFSSQLFNSQVLGFQLTIARFLTYKSLSYHKGISGKVMTIGRKCSREHMMTAE